MRNVTVTLEEGVASWARVYAARHDMSLSRMLGEILRGHMVAEEGYAGAERAFFAVEPRSLRVAREPLPRREELYDRPVLR